MIRVLRKRRRFTGYPLAVFMLSFAIAAYRMRFLSAFIVSVLVLVAIVVATELAARSDPYADAAKRAGKTNPKQTVLLESEFATWKKREEQKGRDQARRVDARGKESHA